MNTRTRIRDQERSPVASVLKRAMRKKASQDEPTFALTADVSEAHRQIPIHPCDCLGVKCWQEATSTSILSACLVQRLPPITGRWCQVRWDDSHSILLGTERVPGTWCWQTTTFWNLVARNTEQPSLHSLSCALPSVCLCPGQRQQVGIHQSRHLGISQRRAEWFVKWAREIAATETVHMARFEEGLGRIMCVVGALELKPLPRTSVTLHVTAFEKHFSEGSWLRAFLPPVSG